jgi:anti-sigma factor RsiW
MHLSDEDLELYLLARLPSDRLSFVEPHMTSCSSCASRLAEVAELTHRVLRLSRQLGEYGGVEKRREHRIRCDDLSEMQTFSPFSPIRIPVQLADVSRNGLKVRTPQSVYRGTIVQVRTRGAIVLGEVRYCVASGAEFDVGIQIQDVIPKQNP